jgi:UDP-N-acetylglucosamine acyltransferase
MPIAQTATVGREARIGRDVTIGPYCVIEDHAAIGDGCVIGPHVVIYGCTRLAEGCRVHAGAVLGDLPQDFHSTGEESFVEIGAETTIREHVTIHRASKPGGVTRIGRKCFLMAGSHVGHDALVGDEVTLVNQVLIGGHAQVGDRAVLGGGSMLHQFARVGRLAMLSGDCAVQMDVPPFCMTPAGTSNRVMSLNVVGLRRAGISADDRAALQRAFRIFYRSGMNTRQALAILDREQNPLIREFVDFARSSKRGICQGTTSDEPTQSSPADVPFRLVG